MGNATLLTDIGISKSAFGWDAPNWAANFGRTAKRLHKFQVEVCDDPTLWKVIAWGRRGGKCLEGNSVVYLANGQRTTLRQIQVGDYVLAFNADSGRLVPDVVTYKWNTGLKACLVVRTRSGKKLVLSPEHRVLTFEGWKRAQDLTANDRIASPRKLPSSLECVNRSDEEVRLLAYMIAEGGTTQKTAEWTNADPALVADFIYCANVLGFGVKRVHAIQYRLVSDYLPSVNRRKERSPQHGRHTRHHEWLRANGLSGRSSLNKRLPDWVYEISERQKWMFLAAMIDTDGSVSVDRGRITIDLANRELVRDLEHLFLQVGVIGKVRWHPNRCAGSWELKIDTGCLAACGLSLPLRLKADLLREALRKPRFSLSDCYPIDLVRKLPVGVNRAIRREHGIEFGKNWRTITRPKLQRLMQVYEHDEWKRLEQAEVYWDQIKAIEDDGQHETFDIEVANNHNFVANGLVSHNSVCMGEVYVPRWCLMPGHEDTEVNVFAPFQSQANIIYEYMMGTIDGKPLEGLVKDMDRADPPSLVWKNGCKISFKNLHKGGRHARGTGSDLTVCDESGFILEHVKNNVVGPMQAASKFQERVDISTPNGKEQFYLDYMDGQKIRSDGRKKSFHMPSWGNPAVSLDFLRSERERMTDFEFWTEYGAVFLDNLLSQFPWSSVILPCVNDMLPLAKFGRTVEIPPEAGHRYRGGWDPADRIDRSAVILLDVSVAPKRCVFCKNIAGTGYLHQEKQIAEICHRYNNAEMLMDSTKHDSTLAHLQERDENRGTEVPELADPVHVEGQHWTNEYKREMMDQLRRSMEKREIELPAFEPLLSDLKFYQRSRTPSGLIAMGASERTHDDYVSALAMANWLCQYGQDEISVELMTA